MAEWPDPRSVSVGFAFGHTAYEDPTGLTYEQVAPGADEGDPGDVLGVVRIKRGRIGDAPETGATRIEFALRDTDGKYSPQNVDGDHYGELRRGTPAEVMIDIGAGPVPLARAAVPSWSPDRAGPDIDEQVPIQALGILARIARDNEALSPIRRAVLASNPVAYWPLEDGLDSDQPGAATTDTAPMVIAQTVTFAQDETLQGSAAVADLTAGGLVGTVQGCSSDSWHVEFWFDAIYNTGSRAAYFTTSSPQVYSWEMKQPASASGSFDLLVFAPDRTLLRTIAAPVSGWLETWHHIAITAEQSGTGVQVRIYVDGVLEIQDTIPTSALGGVTGVVVNDLDGGLFDWRGLAHFAVGNGTTASDAALAGDAYAGESAADRLNRLCTQGGIPSVIASGTTAAMGPQPVASTLQIMRECEDADHGLLFEVRSGLLGYRPNSTRYNVTPVAVLEFGAEDVESTDVSYLRQLGDDRDLYNIITVIQPNGTFAVAEDRTGPVGSNETTGVGPRRMPPATRNLYLSSDLAHHAGWLLSKGTVNQPRYLVVLDLLAKPELATSLMGSEIRSRIQITGVEAKHDGPETLDLIIEGEEITIGADVGIVVWHCAPFKPWRVGAIADAAPDLTPYLGRAAGDVACALRTAVDTTVTSWPFDPNKFRWTTTAAHFDLSNFPQMQVRAGAELVNVSAISTTAATFVAAGALSHADNAAVTAALFTGHAANDLILLVGRVRSTSAATLAAPAGYTRLPIRGLATASKIQVWAKVHDGSESDPTVTPTGGAAGDTVSGVTVGFRNMPISLADLTDLVVHADSLTNASAQNIAFPAARPQPYPGCVVLVIGGKDDDWTSVATLSGFAEAVDGSTTTGNDQGLVVDYQIQTAATFVSPGSFTVTGGAAAVSHGIVLVLAGGFQTMTVARATNGIAKAHAAGTLLALENPLTRAL